MSEGIQSYPLLASMILCALLIVAAEAGGRMRKRKLLGSENLEKGDIALILGAVLTLLSLMLGFTYAMAGNRYDTRRQLVIEEANAIGTTYLRAQTLPEPQSSELQTLLRQYAALRVEFAEARLEGLKKLREVDARTKQLHGALWSRAIVLSRENPGPVVALFLTSLNETIDLHTKRLAAFRNRVPSSIFPVLFICSAIALWLAGFYFATSTRRVRIMPMIFAVLISCVMWLIMDLDQPVRGRITVSQQSLVELDRDLNHPNSRTP